MKKLSTVIASLILSVTASWAQSTMTDSQIIEYATEQNERGVSPEQIARELMERGATPDQLRRLQSEYQNQQLSGTSRATNSAVKTETTRLRKANGDKPADIVQSTAMATPGTRVIFGHDVFNNKNLTFQSSMNLATPQNYVLGPGDAVNIDVWGVSQTSTTEVISPDGTITVSGVGLVKLAGLTVNQAKNRLRSVMGQYYQGSQIEMTLGQTRSITVSVMGEVKVPGTYTMSAFATVYNALYMAGGPNDIGTLRNVRVFRNGRQITTVDVYDFLLNGKLSGDVRLEDNDIVTVAPYEALVSITGKVKRPMYYEMKRTESIATLISYAGGFTGDAFTKAVNVNRKGGEGHSVFSVGEFAMSEFTLMDEDVVTVDSTINRYQNMVKVEGAVFRPGMYQLGSDISTVKALIEAAAGLKENAITQRAVLRRMKADRRLEMISLNVQGIMEGTTPDVPLCNEDVLYIASNEERNENETVSIVGEVQYPGTFRYAENETIEDLIIQAGGLTEAASLSKVDVFRRIINPKSTEAGKSTAQVFTFELDENLSLSDGTGFELKPFDEVYVRRSPEYNEQENISIEGEVQFSGTYTLSSKAQRLSEAIAQAGGLTDFAYAEGAKLLRQMTQEELDQTTVMLRTVQRYSGKDTIDVSTLLTDTTYPVGIELDKALKNPGSEYDPILSEGDRIIVPKYIGTVKVNGEVLYPNTVYYKEDADADYYIEQAGGITSNGKKSKAIIIYMNGMVARANSKNKPRPGCQIIVPTKNRRNRLSLQEILSIGSSTTSIAAMIATIANMTK